MLRDRIDILILKGRKTEGMKGTGLKEAGNPESQISLECQA